MMVAPEALDGAENVPQITSLQSTPSTDQFTPSFLESLMTVAVKLRVALVSSLLNTGVIVTVIPCGAGGAAARAEKTGKMQKSVATDTAVSRAARLAKSEVTAEILHRDDRIVKASRGLEARTLKTTRAGIVLRAINCSKKRAKRRESTSSSKTYRRAGRGPFAPCGWVLVLFVGHAFWQREGVEVVVDGDDQVLAAVQFVGHRR